MKKSLLVVLALSLFSLTANAAMVTISSDTDVQATWITDFAGQGDDTFETDPFIKVDNGDNARSLVQFPTLFGGVNIPLGSTINSATLTLKATSNGTPNTINFYQVGGVTWDESTVTWNNFGTAPGGVIGTDTIAAPFHTEAGVGASSTVTINVQALVQAWSGGAANNGILIAGASGSDSLDFHSDMSTMGPMIEVDYTAVPEPGAFLMLGLVGLGFGGKRWWKSRKAAK